MLNNSELHDQSQQKANHASGIRNWVMIFKKLSSPSTSTSPGFTSVSPVLSAYWLLRPRSQNGINPSQSNHSKTGTFRSEREIKSSWCVTVWNQRETTPIRGVCYRAVFCERFAYDLIDCADASPVAVLARRVLLFWTRLTSFPFRSGCFDSARRHPMIADSTRILTPLTWA